MSPNSNRENLTINKVFVNKDNQAILVCPKCGKDKTIDASRFKQIMTPVQLKRKCSCGFEYVTILERRKFYRKEVNIEGSYTKVGEPTPIHVIIKDLSRSGLKFEIHGEPNFKVGEKLLFEFRLDNKHKTLIKKEVYVRTISGIEVGTEFCTRNLKNPFDKAYDMALGFYTFP